ncbi:MAG TPA: hypothetical protein PKE37_13720 [Thiomonas arsenitoxydans]|uniref:hypothetical protein n=1 Tax=Thiomonas TaxID=32012 RepID=UPI00257FA49C|nr:MULTISPECIES: hypothetical protein [Thiomonas]HML82818.1 hypothetical protein [Thiomonas arsenitoxydans]
MEELVDASIDYLLHYGDSDHWFFIPQAKDEEDALRYFFCIEGYVERLRRDIRARREAEEGL